MTIFHDLGFDPGRRVRERNNKSRMVYAKVGLTSWNKARSTVNQYFMAGHWSVRLQSFLKTGRLQELLPSKLASDLFKVHVTKNWRYLKERKKKE